MRRKAPSTITAKLAIKKRSDQIIEGTISDPDLPNEADFQVPDEPQRKISPRRNHFVRLAQLRKLRECEQVAAVCYRIRNDEVEFLLVRTGGGRWTFPKGSAEPGLTHAQAAALEAFEEAGVHGRIEEASFTRYLHSKRSSQATELAVSAHLCEVSRLEAPEESNRNPTWFAAAKAKHIFRNDQSAHSGAEMARVVDRAIRRIRRSRVEIKPRPVSSPKAQVIEIDYLRR